jgi:uncharacterized OsmC-like protein
VSFKPAERCPVESIRSAVQSASEYLARHPEAGTGPDATAVAVLDEGLRFRITGPNGEAVTDMGRDVGGGATAPTPGWLMRAALASCDATVIAMEAAREGIELTDLTVTVDSESDSRGVLGIDDSVPPGPLAVRVRIELAARNATEDQLRELVRRAESRSAVGDALAREISVTTEIVPGS